MAKRLIVLFLAVLMVISSPLSALGFDGLPKEIQDDLNKGIRYFDADIGCEGAADIDTGKTVTIIGDSLAVDTQAIMKTRLPDVRIYAQADKQLGDTDPDNPTGLDIVNDPDTDLRQFVILIFGTDSTLSSEHLNSIAYALRDKEVLFVNNYYYGDLEHFRANNTLLANFATTQTTNALADWATAAHADYSRYIEDDDTDTTPTDEGKSLFAGVVYDGLNSMLTIVTSDEDVVTPTNVGTEVVVDESGPEYQAAYNFMKDNELSKNVYIKFKALGLDDLHTAAVVGNFYTEGMNTKYTPVTSSSVGLVGGYGLAQWGGGRTSGSPADGTDRDGGLYRYAISKGEPGLEASWETQVEYAWAEMTGKGPAANYATSQYSHSEFMSKTTLNDAAEYFLKKYERGALFSLVKRQNAANAAYKLFYGLGGSLCGSMIGSGNIAAAAIQLSSGEWEGGCYLWGGGHGSYDDQKNRLNSKWRPQSTGGVDCSGFVSAAVSYAVGRHVTVVTSTTNPGKDWQKIPTPEPGAISTSSGHVEIITKVENGKATETIGSHTSGCGVGKGPSPSSWGAFDHGNYFIYSGEVVNQVEEE